MNPTLIYCRQAHQNSHINNKGELHHIAYLFAGTEDLRTLGFQCRFCNLLTHDLAVNDLLKVMHVLLLLPLHTELVCLDDGMLRVLFDDTQYTYNSLACLTEVAAVFTFVNLKQHRI